MAQRKTDLTNVIMPTAAEDAEITRAAEADPDSGLWTDEEWARARPIWDFPGLVEPLQRAGKLGRPPLPEDEKKRRVTLYLDPDVIAKLKEDGPGWQTRANKALRRALGL